MKPFDKETVKSVKPGDRVEVYEDDQWIEVTVKQNDGSGIPIEAESGDWYFAHNVRPIERPVPAEGMTSAELADEVGSFIDACRSRITGVGDEQYAEQDGQKFERMPIGDLITMAREEAQDLAVYAAMMDIRLARLERAFKGTK